MRIIQKNTKNAGKDVEKKELSQIVGGNANWYRKTVENNMEASQKFKRELLYDLTPLPGIIPSPHLKK